MQINAINTNFLNSYKLYSVAILFVMFTLIFTASVFAENPPVQKDNDPNTHLKSSKYIKLGVPEEFQDKKKTNAIDKNTNKEQLPKIKNNKKHSKYIRQSDRPKLWLSDDGLRIATIHINNRKYVQAIDILEKVLQRQPKNSDAYAFMGYSYLQLDILDKAKKNLQYALKLYPKHMGAHLYMGLLHLKNNKKNLALESLQALKIICKGMICAEEEYLANKINLHSNKAK